jgi:hypothetical protein
MFTSPSGGPEVTQATTPKQSGGPGCVIWGLIAFVALAIGGSIFMANFSLVSPMPELRRPTAVLQGAIDLGRGTRRATFEAALRLDDGAVAAMREGDGLVHLELDVETEADVESLLVGVRWTNRAEVVRAIMPLPLDQDVRWTYGCENAADCERTIGIDIQLADGAEPGELSWRLVATVRPPRDASVPEVAVVELELVEASE